MNKTIAVFESNIEVDFDIQNAKQVKAVITFNKAAQDFKNTIATLQVETKVAELEQNLEKPSERMEVLREEIAVAAKKHKIPAAELVEPEVPGAEGRTIEMPAMDVPMLPAAEGASAEQVLAEIREVLSTKVKDHKEALKTKLDELGSVNVTKLDPKHYVEFLDFLNSL